MNMPLRALDGSMTGEMPKPRHPLRTAAAAAAPARDLRPDFAVSLHRAGLYSFPRATRAGMIAEILSRPLKADGGAVHLCWDLRMNFPWNRSGRIRGGHEVSPEHDARWKDLLENDRSIFHEACAAALRPWLDDTVDLLSMDGLMACDFDLVEPGRDTLVLKTFASLDMRFSGREDFNDRITGLEDETLALLWVACRALDADLSPRARAEAMAIEMNVIRAQLEEEWVDDIYALQF